MGVLSYSIILKRIVFTRFHYFIMRAYNKFPLTFVNTEKIITTNLYIYIRFTLNNSLLSILRNISIIFPINSDLGQIHGVIKINQNFVELKMWTFKTDDKPKPSAYGPWIGWIEWIMEATRGRVINVFQNFIKWPTTKTFKSDLFIYFCNRRDEE